MIPITKILAPVDLSARSSDTATYAVSMAAELGSELLFLHVPQHGWPLEPEEADVRDQIVNEAGGPHRLLFRNTPLVSAILNVAEAERVDLILMPIRGKPILSRFFEGSVTAQVLRAARCAVWVGVDNWSPLSSRPIRNILCGLSMGPRASAVLQWAGNLTRNCTASLSVIHANKALDTIPGPRWNHECGYWRRTMAGDNISEIQTRVGTEADIWIEAGEPLAAIPALADHLRADLLVIGKSPERRLFGDLRTLSYEMACRMPCPVASV